MDYETKRLRIVMWTVVALLILSIVGASLLFATKMRHDELTPNVVNVGARIARGGGLKSNLTNADVWDGTSSTDWTGSGTSSSPYLITGASQLAGLSTSVNNGTTYAGKYFKLANDLDMNGDTYLFTPIGSYINYSKNYFKGNFDGAGHSIVNLQIATDMEGGLFGYVANSTISNLNMEIIFTQDRTANFGGLAGRVERTNVSNVNVSYSGILHSSKIFCIAGLIRTTENSTIQNCAVNNFTIDVEINNDDSHTKDFGGLIAESGRTFVTGCIAEFYANIKLNKAGEYPYGATSIGGLIGMLSPARRYDIYNNNLAYGKLSVSAIESLAYIGGLAGRPSYLEDNYDLEMCNNLSQCDIEVIDTYGRCHVAGFATGIQSGAYSKYNISNGTISASSKFNMAGGVDTSATSTAKVVYNKDKFSVTGASSLNTVGATSDANMKLRSTYAEWENFDTYWIIDEKYNSGYPMLKTFKNRFLSPLFEGKGTENEPYLIQTQQDLLNINEYYANTDSAKADVYFKLMNDIDVSKDSNNLPIHFTPICYNIEFDGYFDGNNKTISGLLIDNQYEYTGLFGTIGANHWVKNLTVKGNIYWDQAYAVGGVAGRVMDGGYLQNCKFDGNIIGVLNTKQSTETNGVIGKYGINGAIDCTATYTDLKYAKIGGTTDAPTYTYYLYDWARITTSLYNKKVG